MTRPAPAAFRLPARFAVLALAIAAALVLPPRPSAAQGTPESAAADSLVEVRLADGSVLIGRILEETPERLVVVTQGGTRVELDRAQVRSVRPAAGRTVKGEFWPQDPHATRLFFGPTARSLRQGEGYLGVFELLFPFVAYGVTDRVTLAGGTPIVPGAFGRVLYLAPKVEVVRTPAASFAVGGLALLAATEDVDDGSVGILYGVGTFGGADRSLTVGAGFPFIVTDDESELFDQPLVMLGGELRATRRTKFITENYVVPGEGGALVSGGIRFFGERLSADFGLGAFVGDGVEGPLPIVNFVYSFGGR